MSGLPEPAIQRNCMSAARKRYKYFRKVLKFDQMDFEFAIWQMLYLFISPQKVFKNFKYRKHTKSQFARDDPAFLILFAIWMFITSLAFSTVLKLSFPQVIGFLFYRLFIDCLAVSVLVASFFWYTFNSYCIDPFETQDVEWGYCFDVHLNAFVPPLIILDFIQLFVTNLVTDSLLVGNTFWVIGINYYFYITYLGYKYLGFVQHTKYLMYPMPLFTFLYIITLMFRIDVTADVMIFYKLFTSLL